MSRFVVGMGHSTSAMIRNGRAIPRPFRAQRYTADDPRKARPPHTSRERENSATDGLVSYFPGPGVSFGGTPMTFTPEPRATSIACTTRSYFTLGSPFTKMIFSGRGS